MSFGGAIVGGLQLYRNNLKRNETLRIKKEIERLENERIKYEEKMFLEHKMKEIRQQEIKKKKYKNLVTKIVRYKNIIRQYIKNIDDIDIGEYDNTLPKINNFMTACNIACKKEKIIIPITTKEQENKEIDRIIEDNEKKKNKTILCCCFM